MRKTLATVTAVGLLAGALTTIGGPAKADQTEPAPAPVIVGTDKAGDWARSDGQGGTAAAPVGDALGQDLIEASIAMVDAETANFVIKVTKLPSTGGWPEVTRYIWGMMVDGSYVELDGKFTNYSRGACDPTAGTCPPPQDPGQQTFLIRANCEVNAANVQTCQEVGRVKAVFDAAAGTITIPVQLALINAKPGSKIEGGASNTGDAFGAHIIAMPSAFFSSTATPGDGLAITTAFVVPGAEEPEVIVKPKKKKKKKA